LSICRAIVRNEHDAEDAFQATFLVLAIKARKLQAHESLGPWLSAVARRVASGARTQALAREARERRAAGERARRFAAEPFGDDVSAVLHEEIDRLPERYRLPLLLCDLESQSHQEAARRLGWPLGTVKSRQARARQRLRDRLRRRGVSTTLGLPELARAGRSARAVIRPGLIESTAKAAADFILSGTDGRIVSASVSALVTNTLRTMIMIKLSTVMGVLLTLGIGLVATVLAQDTINPANASRTPASASSIPGTLPPQASTAGVIEYEVRIWKDGAPVTPTMRMKAVPGDTSHIKIPEGTLYVRFQPHDRAAEVAWESTIRRDTAKTLDEAAPAQLMEQLANTQKRGSGPNTKKPGELLSGLADLTLHQHDDAKAVSEVLAQIGKRQGAAVKDDHEKRLAEIERKLERILSALNRSDVSDPAATKKK
jgi:RNA polymerase sigma-70 factor (ECF subfamily)